jgi:hypothetical protein
LLLLQQQQAGGGGIGAGHGQRPVGQRQRARPLTRTGVTMASACRAQPAARPARMPHWASVQTATIADEI